MTNQEYIFKRLRRAGYTAAGAAGIVGNLDAESNCEPCRVQSDFDAGYPFSKKYTAEVDSGLVSRDQFVNHGPGGGGYGIAQWTYPTRKAGLYDMAKACRTTIGDIDIQIDWLLQELMTGEYSEVSRICKSTKSVEEASYIVLTKFEKPANAEAQKSVRSNLAMKYYNLYAMDDVQTVEDLEGNQTPAQLMDAQESYWPPRVICEGMEGPDVLLAKAMILCHGYDVKDISMKFDEDFTKTVKEFQMDHWLKDDGIVGPLTNHAGGIMY